MLGNLVNGNFETREEIGCEDGMEIELAKEFPAKGVWHYCRIFRFSDCSQLGFKVFGSLSKSNFLAFSWRAWGNESKLLVWIKGLQEGNRNRHPTKTKPIAILLHSIAEKIAYQNDKLSALNVHFQPAARMSCTELPVYCVGWNSSLKKNVTFLRYSLCWVLKLMAFKNCV